MDTLFPAPAWSPCTLFLTCLMSLKEEGTHKRDFKINSRKQSSLVLGSTPCWWSHCCELTPATMRLEDFEVWQQLGFVGGRPGLFTDDSLHFSHSPDELGQDLKQAQPCHALSPCWSVCHSSSYLFSFGWSRAASLSTREVLQWVCHPTQAKPMLSGWWFFRII